MVRFFLLPMRSFEFEFSDLNNLELQSCLNEKKRKRAKHVKNDAQTSF